MTQDTRPLVINWVTLILLSIIWGSSFILMKRGLESFSYLQVAALRIFIAFVFLSPILIQHIKKTSKKMMWPIFFSGLFGIMIPAFLFTKAQTVIDSSLSGILNSLVPLFTLFIGILWLKNKLKALQFSGALISFFGSYLLMSSELNLPDNGQLPYAGLVLLATLFYGINVNLIKKHLQEVNALSITSISFGFIGPPAGIYLLYSDLPSVFAKDENAWSNFFYIAVLAIVGSAISIIIFNQLIKKTSAIFAASCTYLIPIVAILWGFADGETLSLVQLIGVLVILSGVYLVNKKKSTQKGIVTQK